MNWSFNIAFWLFVLSLAATVVGALWVDWFQSETVGKMVATTSILSLAFAFYTAMCDAWLRRNCDHDRKATLTKSGQVY